MTGGSRRFHHKSRNGCGQCKKRHIKCDLQAPICANCSKKGLHCDYLDLQYHQQQHHQQPHAQHHAHYHGQPLLRHSDFRTPPAPSSNSNSNSNIPIHADPTASRKRRLRQGQQDPYAVLTFRVDSATPSCIPPATAPTSSLQPVRQASGDAASTSSARTPLDWKQLRPPEADMLTHHWHTNTALSLSIAAGDDKQKQFWDFRPMVKQQPYIDSVSRCVASLHINALRAASKPSYGGSGDLSTVWSTYHSDGAATGRTGHRGGSLNYAGAIIPYSSEAPEVFEAYKQLSIALASFRAQVTKLDRTNWVNCGTFATAVLVFRLDHARRAPPHDLQAIVVDPLRALSTTAAMGDQMMKFLPVSHMAALGAIQERQERAQSEGSQGRELVETLEALDRLIQRVEAQVGQEAVLPLIRYRALFDQCPPRSDSSTRSSISSSYSPTVHDYRANSRSPGSTSSTADGEDRPPLDCRLQAAAALRSWAEHIAGRPTAWHHLISVISWSSHVSEEFISLILKGDPIALIITLYWLVIMDRIVDRWYLEGWAKKGAMAILRRIRPGWEDMLRWPMVEFGFAATPRVENEGC